MCMDGQDLQDCRLMVWAAHAATAGKRKFPLNHLSALNF